MNRVENNLIKGLSRLDAKSSVKSHEAKLLFEFSHPYNVMKQHSCPKELLGMISEQLSFSHCLCHRNKKYYSTVDLCNLIRLAYLKGTKKVSMFCNIRKGFDWHITVLRCDKKTGEKVWWTHLYSFPKGCVYLAKTIGFRVKLNKHKGET